MGRCRTLILIASLTCFARVSACGDDPPVPTTVAVAPSTAELTALGATVQLRAEVLDQYGEVMAGAAVVWSSSFPPGRGRERIGPDDRGRQAIGTARLSRGEDK